MTFINRAPIDENGAVLATTDIPDGWPSLGGFRYSPEGALAVVDDVPDPGHPYLDGIRITPEGNIYIWSFEVDGEPTPQWHDGIPCTDDGRLVVTSDLPPVSWVGGWPLAANGYVCMSGVEPPPDDCTSPTTIFTQAFDSAGTGSASQNDPNEFGAFAKSFVPFTFSGGAIVTDLHWTGGRVDIPPEFPNRHPTAWLIEFWNDNAGQPGTLAQTATFTPALANETSIGTVGGVDCYTYSVDILPWFLADPGVTYWVSVQPTLIYPPGWIWMTAGAGSSWLEFFGEGSAVAFDLAIEITGCVGAETFYRTTSGGDTRVTRTGAKRIWVP